jgi:amino acid permease
LLEVSPGDFAFLFLAALGLIILVGRFIEDGFAYCTSICALVGDAAIVIAIWISCKILHETRAVPGIFNTVQSQWLIAIGCFFIGVVMQIIVVNQKKKFGKIVDCIHNVIVVPIILFLAVTLALVVPHGSPIQTNLISALVAIWVILLWYDARTGRLDQPEWFWARGTNLPLRKIVRTR